MMPRRALAPLFASILAGSFLVGGPGAVTAFDGFGTSTADST